MKLVYGLILHCLVVLDGACTELSTLPPTILAAGDIADCGPGAEKTARHLEKQLGLILALGDLAYPRASKSDFQRCYVPTWGKLQGRIRSVPGNHEYMTESAKPYFAQMGAAAGPPGKGYYSIDFYGWHIVGLNSYMPIGKDSEQIKWLMEDLSVATAKCILAFAHLPRFSSGEGGDNEEMETAWRILQGAGVSVMLAGHDHLYERFALMDASGGRDTTKGMRSFTVGSGGAYLDKKPWWRRRNSEALITSQWGVLKVELAPDSYTWAFTSVDGRILDKGSSYCNK